MRISQKAGFFVYQNKDVKNFNLLNDAGLVLMGVLRDMFRNPKTAEKFYNNVDSIIVTSQDRSTRNNNHSNGNAIDITVYPAGMHLWLFNELRAYKYTVYISGFNRHIHFDLREEGRSGVEVLRKPGTFEDVYPKSGVMSADGYNIRIEAPERIQSYLLKFYEVYKLKDLKLEILAGLNNPFVGIRKTIQYNKYKVDEFIQKELIPAFTPSGWFSWWMIPAGLVVVYLYGKKLGSEKHYISVGE